MNNTQIDEAILNVVDNRWMKVAMVVVKVEEALRIPADEREAGHHSIAKRIEKLAEGGHLVGRGNLELWRRSEVRRPSNSTLSPNCSK